MATLTNVPKVRLGVVGVSRNCFPAEVTRRRLKVLMASLKGGGVEAVAAETVIESERDAMAALAEMADAGCNAAVIYLGNFGPEGPTTIFAERFPGPVMVCAAAEENREVLAGDRGDALCGLLNCSYNLGLRRMRTYIPARPVGLPDELASAVRDFVPIARVVLGVGELKVFTFGPRPQDFYACNAPIQPLMDLGVEVMENSELDLLQLYRKAAERTADIERVAADMQRELGQGAAYPDLLPKLAQFELALEGFMAENLGASRYGVFADKCWPAFEAEFGFVPCYVNSRLAGRGIPVACEVDMYGAVSEYVAQLASLAPATLLDVNNSVPDDVLPQGADLKGADRADLFMGFHCGNTASACMKTCSMKFQLIMNRLMEDGGEADITRGTLEGQIAPGPVTMLRLQGSADAELLGYAAEGHVLDVDPASFGCIGVVAIPGFARFYRHALIARHFPHHTAIGFAHVGGVVFEALRLLGIDDISTPRQAGVLYDGENPF